MSIRNVRDRFHTPATEADTTQTVAPQPGGGVGLARAAGSAARSFFAPLKRLSERKFTAGTGFYAVAEPGCGHARRPDVRGSTKARPVIDADSLTARMSASRKAALGTASDRNVVGLVSTETRKRDELLAMLARRPVAASGVRFADALADRASFDTLVGELFGPGAQALADDLAAHMQGPGRHAGLLPTMLAAGLMEVCNGRADVARQVLADLARPPGPPAPDVVIATLAERLRRTLALTDTGMTALLQVEQAGGVAAPADTDAYQKALQLCHVLEASGHAPHGAGATGTVAQFIAARPPAIDLARDIGHANDHALLVVYKALDYADKKARGRPTDTDIDASNRYAYFACKDDHFSTSATSGFNAMIGRITKLATYVQRGTISERTLKNIGKDALRVFKRMVSRGKSPMEHMRLGARGSNLGTLAAEKQKFEAGLRQAITDLQAQLRTEAETIAARLTQQPSAVDRCLLARTLGRIATLEWWATEGRKGIRPNPQAIIARAAELAGGLPNGLNVHVLGEDGRRTIAQDIAGRLHAGRKLDIALLEAWTVQAGIATVGLQALRATARGGSPDYALMKWQDLANAVKGRAPRAGFGPDDMRSLALGLVQGGATATYADGSMNGLNSGGINVNGGPLPFAIVPILRGENGYGIRLEIGNDGPRFVFSLCHVHNSAVAVGAGVGTDIGSPVPAFAVGAGAAVDFNHSYAHTRGASLIVRKDMPDTDAAALSERVINFLFDQATLQPPPTPAQWWKNFVDAFGDEPAVSLCYVDNAAHKDKLSVRGGISLKLKQPKDTVSNSDSGRHIGLGLGLQFGTEWEHSSQEVDNGRFQVATQVRVRKTQLSGNVSLVGSAGKIMNRPAEEAGQHASAGLNAIPVVGAGFQFDVSACKVITQIARQDGRTVARQTKRDYQFSSPEVMLKFINEHRSRYEHGAATINADGQPIGGADALDAFKQRLLEDHSPGQMLYGVEQSLTEEAAQEHGRLVDLAAAFSSIPEPTETVRAKLEQLERQMQDLLRDESSWRMAALYTIGIHGETQTHGIDFLLKMQHVGGVTSARLEDVLVLS